MPEDTVFIMQAKNSEKKSDSKELKKTISPILVADQSRLRPFIDLFENYPENIALRGLGTMLGFFKINDRSEDSAYIVNFLSSVIKKEYFTNHKRPVSESLDSALHKVNLALAEIAKNGNIRWIGQLDAAICVLEKNILHFTVCGAAKILLLRNQMLSDISQNLNPEELEPNPIKTFSNVSSGYLEKDDKIIITSNELFDIFSLNEIKKGSFRFDQEKFVRFLKTAMVNELHLGATIVIDVNENEVILEKKKSKVKEGETTLNPFSGKSFEKPVIQPENSNSAPQKEYTDEKTGHIYVQGDPHPPEEKSLGRSLGVILGEKSADFSYWLKNRLRKIKFQLKKSGSSIKQWIAGRAEKRKYKKEKALAEQTIKPEPDKIIAPVEEPIIQAAEKPVEIKIKDPDSETWGETFVAVWKKLPALLKKINFSKLTKSPLKNKLKKILPDFSKMFRYFSSLDYQHKIYAILLLILILVVPIFISKMRASKPKPIQETPVAQPNEKDLLFQDSNVREVSPDLVSSRSSNPKKMVILNNKVFAVSAEKIVGVKENGTMEETPVPQDSNYFSRVFTMEDLNLIFLLSDNGKLISFSPISRQFKENALILPGNVKIEGAGTYLTYLYIFDSQNNQIYRYPRSEGGFGEKTDWLKETVDLKNLSDLSIEESIFLAQNNKIVKLLRGTKQEFNPDPTAVPLTVNKIFTGRKISNLYALDSKNGRVAKFSKDGILFNQYYNEGLKKATDFAVDEPNNKVYFITPEGLFSFSM